MINKTTTSWGSREWKLAFAGIAASIFAAVLVMIPSSAHAQNIVFDWDTSVDLLNGAVILEIDNSSTANSIIYESDTITVNLLGGEGGESLTIRAPGDNTLLNDAGEDPCTLNEGDIPEITFNGPLTVTITASAVLCAGGLDPDFGASNTSGGGAGAPPVSTTPTITATLPISGAALTGNGTADIGWVAGGQGITLVDLYYSTDGGTSYALIAMNQLVGSSPYSWSVPNTATTTGVVRVLGFDGGRAQLAADDISSFSIALDEAAPLVPPPSEPPPGEELTREEANEFLPPTVLVDDLVKGSLSSVYYIGLDAKRHPFPTSQIFTTWFAYPDGSPDFTAITTISDADLASISLGAPVLPRPATLMVKIQSATATYALEPGSRVLRWVSSEEVAVELYGPDWNQRVMDVDPTLFGLFTIGDDLVVGDIHPKGSLMRTTADPAVYYLDGTDRRPVNAAGFSANYFQDRFVTQDDRGLWKNLPLGNPIEGFEDVLVSQQFL